MFVRIVVKVVFAILWGLILLAGSAAAETVAGIDIVSGGGQTHVTIARVGPSQTPRIFQLGGDQPRIVIDYVQADWGAGEGGLKQTGHGVVRHVRYARQGERGLRVVLDLQPGATLASHAIDLSQISLVLGTAGGALPAASTGSRYFKGETPYPRIRPRAVTATAQVATSAPRRAKNRKPVIVIDPGHGGRDPGAIGNRGTHEKTITLKASSELKRQLVATGRYEVVMTRTGDKYIAHEERLRIARAGGADLFISVHADSTKSKSARGASVYTLADRAKKRSKTIIDTQNWIMDVDLATQSDPVGDILVDLAQRKTNSQSEMFADILVGKLSNSTKLIGNTHRRAGYFVLLAPDVPAVLLELGFISNSQDERLLKSAAHRKKVMGSVVTAINLFFDTQKS